MIHFFLFVCLLAFLPKHLFPWLACLMMKWSISGHLTSHCVFETLQVRSGQLFWLKTYLVCLAELKELPVGGEPFFAHVRTHVSQLTVVTAWWVYREMCFWTDGLSSSSYWTWLQRAAFLLPQSFKTRSSVHSERGPAAVWSTSFHFHRLFSPTCCDTHGLQGEVERCSNWSQEAWIPYPCVMKDWHVIQHLLSRCLHWAAVKWLQTLYSDHLGYSVLRSLHLESDGSNS